MATLETAATILSTLAYGETSKIARLATREPLPRMDLPACVSGVRFEGLSRPRRQHRDRMQVVRRFGVMKAEVVREFAPDKQLVGELACAGRAVRERLAGDAQRCFDAGMDDYLAKPFDAIVFEHKLDDWVIGSGVNPLSGEPLDAGDVSGGIEVDEPATERSDDARFAVRSAS